MRMDRIISELRPFFNEKGQLTALPGKYKKKLIAYHYLASKIELGKRYTEAEINEILNSWTTFRDPATLRRELFDRHLLNRTKDCRSYWREGELPPLEEFIADNI